MKGSPTHRGEHLGIVPFLHNIETLVSSPDPRQRAGRRRQHQHGGHGAKHHFLSHDTARRQYSRRERSYSAQAETPHRSRAQSIGDDRAALSNGRAEAKPERDTRALFKVKLLPVLFWGPVDPIPRIAYPSALLGKQTWILTCHRMQPSLCFPLEPTTLQPPPKAECGVLARANACSSLWNRILTAAAR